MEKYTIKVNGVSYEVEIEACGGCGVNSPAAAAAVKSSAPAAKPVCSAPKAEAPKSEAPKGSADGKSIKSPLPGTVLRINVSEGQAVKKGDVLVTIEAMKMENDVMAVEDGVVASVCVSKGQSVEIGDVLVTF